MPQYYRKKESQEERREEIQTSVNKYLLTVRTSDYSTMIFIGGLDSWCISAQVIHAEPIASLSQIVYDEACSLSGRYKRGIDTQHVLALTLSYIHNTFPHITQIAFDDYSQRSCDERQRIDLASFYYVFYGATWYMAKMGATFQNKSDDDTFVRQTRRFQELKTSWEDFDKYVTTAHPLPVATMKQLFDESSTWQLFFNKLKERVDIGDLCFYMAPWIDTFVTTMTGLCFRTMKMVMPVPNPALEQVAYTTKVFVQHGGRYTRKQRKRCNWGDLQ